MLRKEIDKLTEEYSRYQDALSNSQGLRGAGDTASKIRAKRNLPKVANTLKEKQNQMSVTLSKIERLQDLVAAAESDIANFEAIETEATVRESYDKAGEVRLTKDNAVHRSIQHKNAITSIAARYERETIETLKARIASRKDLVSAQIFDANQKVERLKKIKQLDMISKDTAERILHDFQKKNESAMDSMIVL